MKSQSERNPYKLKLRMRERRSYSVKMSMSSCFPRCRVSAGSMYHCGSSLKKVKRTNCLGCFGLAGAVACSVWVAVFAVVCSIIFSPHVEQLPRPDLQWETPSLQDLHRGRVHTQSVR